MIFSMCIAIFSASLMSANAFALLEEEYKKVEASELDSYLKGKVPRLRFDYEDGFFEIFPLNEYKEIIVYDDDKDKAYFIDRYPEHLMIFPSNSEKLRLFSDSGLNTSTGRGYGFIDRSGKVVVKPTYELGDVMFSSVAVMGNFSEKGKVAYDLVNDKGEVVTDKKYRFISRFMMPKSYLKYDSRYTFKVYNSDFFKDYTPTEYAYFMQDTEIRYDLVISFKREGNKYPDNWGIFAGKKGLMDKSGKEILPDVYYDILVGEGDIIGIARERGKYGYVNSSGGVILPMQYQMASRFRNGIAAIVRDNEIAFINKDLKVVQDYKKASHWESVYQVGDIDALTNAYYDKANYSGSKWAREYIVLADSINIIPPEIKSKYSSKISRQEFCELLINAILVNSENPSNSIADRQQATLSKAFNDESPMPFKDTKDEYVELAYKLGIVNGKSKNIFDPNGAITRQEASAMLIRAYKKFADPARISEQNRYNASELKEKYNDFDQIANWARADVFLSNNIGLMNGVGAKRFDPKGTYTVEQSVTTIIRLYEGI